MKFTQSRFFEFTLALVPAKACSDSDREGAIWGGSTQTGTEASPACTVKERGNEKYLYRCASQAAEGHHI